MNTQQPSPEPILRATTGFMVARLLGTAVELGVFEHLGDGCSDLAALASDTGLPQHRLRVVLDAMVAIGFLERDGVSYRCAPVAVAYLTENGQRDLRPFIRFMHRMQYESWLRFEKVVRSGTRAVKEKVLSRNEQILVSEGIAAVTYPAAQALAQQYDFSVHTRLLDVGGGTGSFLEPVLDRYPRLRAILLDRPEVTEVARQRLTASELSGRIRVQAGDMFTCALPTDADVILMANVVHIFSPERNRQLLGRLRESAQAGTRLLLVDFWTDDSHAEPAFAAIMAGEFLLASGEGAVYSVAEIGQWLDACGWVMRDRVPLAGPASLVVGETA